MEREGGTSKCPAAEERRAGEKEREREREIVSSGERKRVAALLSGLEQPRKTGVIIKKVGGLLSRRHFIH